MWLFILAGTIFPASAQISSVVNAASQVSGAPVAPGTIITIFGAHLAPAVAVTPGSATPPSALGGVTVTVAGIAAPLYYVSPTQINAVLSFSTPAGSQNLTVASAAGTFSTTLNIAASAQPGIFSLLGTGTGDGAIINPLTLAIGNFTVRSGEEHTFLSIYLTGLDTSVTPVVTVGGVPVNVLYSGASPCCYGLEQINVVLPESLSGAGRVQLAVQSGTQVSNTVEVVLLPAIGEGPFPDDEPDQPRSRELAAVAYIPGSSLALVADEDDDVIRVADVSKRAIVRTISLPSGSGPVAVAVNATGSTAVIAERRTGSIAIVDLTQFAVNAQVAVGSGPLNVAIAGHLAVVVNGDAGSVTIVDLNTKAVVRTIATGAGAHAVDVDPVALKAWVTNQDSGTITVIDLASLTATNTFSLGANLRIAAVRRIPNSNFLAISVPAAGNAGQVLIVNINDGTSTSISVNPDLSGGSSDIAINGSTLFFANQTGGSVSVTPVSLATGVPTGSPVSIKVGLGVRALAVDSKDNLLLVSNDGSGTIVLVDLATLKVAGHIDAVHTGMDGDDESDDHSDHDHGANLPIVSAVTPVSVRANSTFTLTVSGTGLAGAYRVLFVNPAEVHGNGKGKGKGDAPDANADGAFSVNNVAVDGTGTTLTATVTVRDAGP
ncbi:MAG TPA: hypothetical protein VHB50_01445, partial [Bryobacteraceae bacterium]|nr:hypothetical protein [Bryobacteraceae bacterium]